MSQGAILVKRGVNDVLNVPGGVGTLDSPGRRFSFVTSPGTIGRMLVLPPASLERAGRALLGDNFEFSEDISFDMRNAAGRAVVRNTSAIFQELGELSNPD